MIQPLSLEFEPALQALTEATKTAAESHLDEVRAQRFYISSGQNKGATIAYLRLTEDDHTGAELWLLATHDGRHAGGFNSYDAALHAVMAQAYIYAARAIENVIRDAERAKIRAEAQERARKHRANLLAHYIANGGGQQQNQGRHFCDRLGTFTRSQFDQFGGYAYGCALMVMALEAAA